MTNLSCSAVMPTTNITRRDFPQLLTQAIKMSGLSRLQVAARMRVTPRTLWRWETGKALPSNQNRPWFLDWVATLPREVQEPLLAALGVFVANFPLA
ncbi:MAG TPA: helix-turn-helix transcriptional regulator, partial [Polyangiaceae bacterium]